MASITIDKNKLEHYNEKVSKAKFAILFKSLSNDQKETLNKLVAFLKEYLGNAKYQKQSIDAQNFYFSKRHVENIIEIFKDNASISDKTISTYISTALKDSALDDFMFSKSDVQTLEKKIKNALQSILDKVVDDKKDTETPEKEKSPTIVAGEISKYVKESIYIPKLNLGKTVLGFLNKNVFLNLANAINSKKFEFAGPDKISKNLFKRRFTFFTKIWNPTVADIKRPFRRFEIQVTRGFVYKAKKQVRRFAKNVTGFFNILFPVVILAKVLKYGIGFVKFGVKAITKSIKFVYKTVSKAISFAVSSVKFVVRTAIRTGVGAIKLLTKTLKKVGALKLIKLSSKLLLGFFRTHAGAYLLGFIVGTIVRKLSGIFDLLKSIKDGALTIFGNVSNFINEHIMPYLDPILTGIKNLINAISFYGDEIYKSFNDEKENGLAAQLDTIFTNAIPTHPDFNPKIISSRLLKYQMMIEDVFSNVNLSDIFTEGIMTVGSGMLGSLVGAKLGAALGTMIFPGIGTIAGGIIGSLLGGMGGEWLGRQLADLIKKNAAYKKVNSDESKLQKYLRQTIGANSIRSAEYFGNISSAPHVSLLRKLGSISFEKSDIENSQEIKELKQYGIDLSKTFQTYKKANNINGFRDILSKFQYIDNLNYYSILNEVNSTLSRMSDLFNSSGHKGFISKVNLNDSDYTTTLTLGPTNLTIKSSEANFNPLWFKVIRGYELNKLVNRLRLNQITPAAFIEEYNKLSIPENYKNSMFEVKHNNIVLYGKNLIFRNFSSEELKAIQNFKNSELANIKAHHTNYQPMFMDPNDPNYDLTVMLHAEEMDSVAEQAEKDWINRFGMPWDKWMPIDAVQLTTSSLSREFIPAMFLKLKTEEVKTNFGENFNYSMANDKAFGSSAIRSVLDQMKTEGTDISLINQADIEYKLEQAKSQIDGRGLTDEQANQLIRSIALKLIENAASDFRPQLAILEAQIGSRLRLPESNGKSLSEMTSDELKKAFEGADGNNMEIATLIAAYKEMTGEDSDFLRERILPFVENLIKQGANAQTIYGIFGIPYSSDNRLPTADTAGEMADPSAGL